MFKVMCGCVLAAMLVVGCNTTQDADEPLGGSMQIDLKPSNRSIAAGDTVTIVSSTQNLTGRNAEIQWATTGGRISLSDDNRIARVRFDNPGRYTVTAQAMVNGTVVDTSTVQIDVRPVEPAVPRFEGGQNQRSDSDLPNGDMNDADDRD